MAAGWTLFIPLLSLLPPSFFSAAGRLGRFPHMDKVVHAGIYGVQTVLLIAAWRDWKRISGPRLFWMPVLLSSLYGLLMEVLQRTLTDCRQFSWGDVAGNVLGALVAALFMVCLIGFRRPV
jgi:VanZ family protein